MESESPTKSEKRKIVKECSPMTMVAVAQPKYVRDAYQAALTEAIRESYSTRREFVSATVHLEEIKSTLINVYHARLADYKKRGLIPNNFDEKFFEFNLKTWVAFMDVQQLIRASLEHNAHGNKNQSWSAPKWRPDPKFLSHLAKALYDDGCVAQEAFYTGNKRGRLFNDNEIEEIKAEIERLGSK